MIVNINGVSYDVDEDIFNEFKAKLNKVDLLTKIFNSVSEFLNVDLSEKRRFKHLIEARMIYTYFMRKKGVSYPQIRDSLGFVNHSTFINLMKRHSDYEFCKKQNSSYFNKIKEIQQIIYGE